MKKIIDENKIPNHIAIIMDGNGRWAKRRLMPRSFGHKMGVERIKSIVEYCISLNIKALSLYALSSENLARPKEEVDELFNLFRQYFSKQINDMLDDGVVLHTMGDLTALPDDIVKLIDDAKERSKDNTKLILNIALNYGGQQEIVNAVEKIRKDNVSVNKDTFKNYLYTSNLPDLDLVIRTGGEMRLSNFLLYQCAYSEFYFSNVMWPDFDEKCLKDAIIDFQNRSRRFGKVSK